MNSLPRARTNATVSGVARAAGSGVCGGDTAQTAWDRQCRSDGFGRMEPVRCCSSSCVEGEQRLVGGAASHST